MYAVIRTGGKQYRVASGQVVKIERLAGEVGDTVAFDQVLMIGDEQAEASWDRRPSGRGRAGDRRGAGAGQGAQGDRVQEEAAQDYRRRRGHRQLQTVLRIRDIAVA